MKVYKFLTKGKEFKYIKNLYSFKINKNFKMLAYHNNYCKWIQISNQIQQTKEEKMIIFNKHM